MATVIRPAKAKAAQRVIEVLDFFDEQHQQASVMDIARRYNRPQSSTSELLASMVDLGLLYKDWASRSYSLTPRAAILGSLAQPRLVRDGTLSALVDDLHAETGLGVVLIGMVGPNAQPFRWKPRAATPRSSAPSGLVSGAQERLCDTAAGWMLLSTLPQQRCEGLLRRLNAEAPVERKFVQQEMSNRIQECARNGYVTGPVGFDLAASLTTILIPTDADDRPIALGLVHHDTDNVDPVDLVPVLRQAVNTCIGGHVSSIAAPINAIAHAA